MSIKFEITFSDLPASAMGKSKVKDVKIKSLTETQVKLETNVTFRANRRISKSLREIFKVKVK